MVANRRVPGDDRGWLVNGDEGIGLSASVFTAAEYEYLAEWRMGRLASIGRGGVVQVHPVGFVVDGLRGCVELIGPDLRAAQLYSNIRRDPRVSLTVGEPASLPAGAGLEIRGHACAAEHLWRTAPYLAVDVVRIWPVRMVAYNVGVPGRSSRLIG